MTDDAEALARALGGKRSGRQWLCPCPAHDDHEPSLILFNGYRAPQLRCLAGCAPAEVIAALKRRGLWAGSGEGRPSFNDPQRAAELAARRAREAREAAWLQARALKIWKQSQPAIGTPVEAVYLNWWRGLLDVPDRKRLLTEVIRFHSRCPRGDQRQPAMVCLLRLIVDDTPRAIHRTFMTAQWAKDGTPMMFAHAGGAAVKLYGRPPCERLFITEGVETALSLIVRGIVDPTADCAVWAAGCAGAMARFPILPAVDELVVAADNDLKGQGQQAAEICLKRWQQAGRRASVMLSPDGLCDFAEALRL
jgi:putative DNA primase/helicase